MPLTFSEEKLGFKSWVDNKYDCVEELPNIYYHFTIIINPAPLPQEEEMTDEEALSLPEKTGMFLFLHDSEEDIYSESDGEPLK